MTKSILSIVSLTLLHVSFASASPIHCQKKLNSTTAKLAHDYMRKNGLIMDGDELTLPDLKIETRWDISKVKSIQNGCLITMAICEYIENKKTCGQSAYEVLGLITSSGQSRDRIVPFEQLIPVPKKLIAQIGSERGTDSAYYFVQLTGKSALDAAKSFETKTPYGGLSGTAVLGKKETFDPTPSRNWLVSNATYSLRRGASAEVLDIQSWQLDGLDESGAEAYWSGCQKPNNTYGQCFIAPWTQSFIRKITPLK